MGLGHPVRALAAALGIRHYIYMYIYVCMYERVCVCTYVYDCAFLMRYTFLPAENVFSPKQGVFA